MLFYYIWKIKYYSIKNQTTHKIWNLISYINLLHFFFLVHNIKQSSMILINTFLRTCRKRSKDLFNPLRMFGFAGPRFSNRSCPRAQVDNRVPLSRSRTGQAFKILVLTNFPFLFLSEICSF